MVQSRYLQMQSYQFRGLNFRVHILSSRPGKGTGGGVLIKARLVGEAATSESSKCWPIPLIERIPTVAYHILTSMTQYFDKSGTYKAYTTDGKHLFNEATEQIGSFVNGFLYDNQGRAIGHVKGKLILDKSGQPLYYTN